MAPAETTCSPSSASRKGTSLPPVSQPGRHERAADAKAFQPSLTGSPRLTTEHRLAIVQSSQNQTPGIGRSVLMEAEGRKREGAARHSQGKCLCRAGGTQLQSHGDNPVRRRERRRGELQPPSRTACSGVSSDWDQPTQVPTDRSPESQLTGQSTLLNPIALPSQPNPSRVGPTLSSGWNAT